MSIALKLAIEDVEAELAAATTPASRAAIQKRLDGHRAALADAQARGSASRAASRVVVATVDPETPAAEVEPKTCSGCGAEADKAARYCGACGAMLPLSDEDSRGARFAAEPRSRAASD